MSEPPWKRNRAWKGAETTQKRMRIQTKAMMMKPDHKPDESDSDDVARIVPPRRPLPPDHKPKHIAPPNSVATAKARPRTVESPAPQPVDIDADATVGTKIIHIFRDKNAPGFHGRAWVPDPAHTEPAVAHELKEELDYETQLACETCLTKRFEVVYFAGETLPRFVCGCGHIWP